MKDKKIKLKYHGAEPQVRGQYHVLMAQQFGFKHPVPHVMDKDFDDVVLCAKEYNIGISVKVNL